MARSPKHTDDGELARPREEAEAATLKLAGRALRMIDRVTVPAVHLDQWLPERLSFIQARDNFRVFLDLYKRNLHSAAGQVARSLFEEAIRWSWVDEDPETRRFAFQNQADWRHQQVAEAAKAQGIDPDAFYGPLVAQTLGAPDDAPRFPSVRQQLGWSHEALRDMMYLQYSLLSQYTHSSLLAAASAAEDRGGVLVSRGQLPLAARGTILRNAIANMAVIFDGCKSGLPVERVRHPTRRSLTIPLNVMLFQVAQEASSLMYEHAPGSA